MNWPLFLHPALLGGLAAVVIPILLHLLLKTRKQRMRFSTLLFFRQPNEQAKRRRRIRNWLLLMARMLLIALLALGFARPYFSDRDAAQNRPPRRQVLFVVDRSASMQATEREGMRWNRAKEAMRKVLSELGATDRATLISCDVRAETSLGPAAPEDILGLLEDLEPTQCKAELSEGLQLAARVAANTGSGFTNTIYIVSDLQRTGCRNIGSYPLPRSAQVKVLQYGDLLAPNVAVTDLNLGTTATAKPQVAIANYSDEDAAPFEMRFLVDGQELGSATLPLAGGGATNIDLALPRLAPGWHSGEVRLQPKDAFKLDDIRYHTYYVPSPVRVLVAETRQAPKVFLEESFFVIAALDPAFDTTNESHSPFQVVKTTPEAMAGALNPADPKQFCQIAILPAMKHVPEGLGARLSAYVQAGGGVLLFLGDTVSANRYLSELGGILPARLEGFESAKDLDWRLWEYQVQSPMFNVFRQPNSGNLALAKFTQRAAMKGYDEGAVLARFQDGAPLIVSRNLGKGRVLLVNTSADTAWTDWPQHRTFVPWLHSVMRYLQRADPATKLNTAATFLTGSETDLLLDPDLKKVPVKVRTPDGQEITSTTDETGTWRDFPLTHSGLYSLRAQDGRELRRIAVNVPVAESDLAAQPANEFETQIARSDPPANASLAASLFGQTPDRRELWRICLLTVFALLFLELMLANRTVA